jgi:hypothetical protein
VPRKTSGPAGLAAAHAERIRLDDFGADQPRWLATVTSFPAVVWLGRTPERTGGAGGPVRRVGTVTCRAPHDRARVLFVCHALERTGPPIYLLTLQRWLRANTDWELTTAFQRGGALEAEFAELGETVRLHNHRYERPAIDVSGYDLVYCNASWPLRALSALDRVRALAVHVHEMEDVIRFLLDDEDRDRLREADLVLVGCGPRAHPWPTTASIRSHRERPYLGPRVARAPRRGATSGPPS